MVVLIELPNGDFVKYPYLANGFVVQIRVDKGTHTHLHNSYNGYGTKTELKQNQQPCKAAMSTNDEEMEVKGERMQTSKM